MTATESDRRAEWLEWRKQGIGASDIAGILSLSPWASPWSVWADKSGLLPDSPSNGPQEYGKRAEPMIRQWFEDDTGLTTLAGEEVWVSNPDKPFIRATPDDVVGESATSPLADALGGLEMKAELGRSRWLEIPSHYQTQGQWQMAATGWDRVWFAVLHGFSFETYVLERDQSDIDFMVKRAEQFWTDHVLTGDPPPVDGHDATTEALAVVYPDARDEAADLTDHAETFKALIRAKAAKKTIETEVKSLSNEIRAAMGECHSAEVDGRAVATLGQQTRKTTCKHCGAVDESNPFKVLREKAKEIESL